MGFLLPKFFPFYPTHFHPPVFTHTFSPTCVKAPKQVDENERVNLSGCLACMGTRVSEVGGLSHYVDSKMLPYYPRWCGSHTASQRLVLAVCHGRDPSLNPIST